MSRRRHKNNWKTWIIRSICLVHLGKMVIFFILLFYVCNGDFEKYFVMVTCFCELFRLLMAVLAFLVLFVEHVWNVLAHAQKPDLVFQRNRWVHLSWRGYQFSWLLAAEVCASAVVMVVMPDTPCSEVECKTTGYPLHSHVSPSLPLPCVTVCHQVSTELYLLWLHVFATLDLHQKSALSHVWKGAPFVY